MDFKEIEIPAWGEGYRPGMPGALSVVSCPGCDGLSIRGLFSRAGGTWVSCIIGFTRETTYRKPEDCAGMVIFECPYCHQKFSIHVDHEVVVEYLMQLPTWNKK